MPICYRAIFQNCTWKCCFLTWRRASENVYCYNKISKKKCVLNVFGVFVSLIFVKLMKRNSIFNQFSLSKSKTNLSFLGALTLIGTASYLTRVLTAPALERPMFSPPPLTWALLGPTVPNVNTVVSVFIRYWWALKGQRTFPPPWALQKHSHSRYSHQNRQNYMAFDSDSFIVLKGI